MPIHLLQPDPDLAQQPGLIPPAETPFSRRSFLGLAVAGLTHNLIDWPSSPHDSVDTWALISDTHISAQLDALTRGSKMSAHLRTVVADVLAAAPAHVLINGDVALSHGRSADYVAFKEMVSPIRNAGIPMHMTIGNHDKRSHFMRAFDLPADQQVTGRAISSFSASGFHWLLLDSLEKVGALRGRLGESQLDWMTRRLDAEPGLPAVICIHHNPDRFWIGLKDSNQFVDAILPRRQVKLVMFGHTHEYRHWKQDGLHFLNLPAVAYRFRKNMSLGWLLARIRPGGLHLEFHGVKPTERDNGTTCKLDWRTDA